MVKRYYYYKQTICTEVSKIGQLLHTVSAEFTTASAVIATT